MIHDPMVRVECDEPGCSEVESIELTALGRGAFDERHVIQSLERMDWRIDGDITICPNHQEDDEEDEDES